MTASVSFFIISKFDVFGPQADGGPLLPHSAQRLLRQALGQFNRLFVRAAAGMIPLRD
jgi:hypothetical protein